MHLGMLEAIEIRMEIVSGNFRCLSISNCGFPAPDAQLYSHNEPGVRLMRTALKCSKSKTKVA